MLRPLAHSPTIGSNVEEVVFKNLHFLMWDIGGQVFQRESWATYYAGAGCVIMVVDSTDRERVAQAREELHKMIVHEDLAGSRVLVLVET